jgi:hypothetical protein
MHDTDRLAGVGDDQRRYLRGVEDFQRLAGQHVAIDRLRIFRHHLVDGGRHQTGAHIHMAAQIAVGDDAGNMSTRIDDADAAKTF